MLKMSLALETDVKLKRKFQSVKEREREHYRMKRNRQIVMGKIRTETQRMLVNKSSQNVTENEEFFGMREKRQEKNEIK